MYVLLESSGRLAQVTLGAHSLSSDEEEKQTFQIKKKVKHPRYNNKTTDNDIMLLQVLFIKVMLSVLENALQCLYFVA